MSPRIAESARGLPFIAMVALFRTGLSLSTLLLAHSALASSLSCPGSVADESSPQTPLALDPNPHDHLVEAILARHPSAGGRAIRRTHHPLNSQAIVVGLAGTSASRGLVIRFPGVDQLIAAYRGDPVDVEAYAASAPGNLAPFAADDFFEDGQIPDWLVRAREELVRFASQKFVRGPSHSVYSARTSFGNREPELRRTVLAMHAAIVREAPGAVSFGRELQTLSVFSLRALVGRSVSGVVRRTGETADSTAIHRFAGVVLRFIDGAEDRRGWPPRASGFEQRSLVIDVGDRTPSGDPKPLIVNLSEILALATMGREP